MYIYWSFCLFCFCFIFQTLSPLAPPFFFEMQRIDKALVMVFDPGTFEQHNCFTVGEFYREHGKMRDQVKKRQSVQSSTAEVGTSTPPGGRKIFGAAAVDTSLSGNRSRETRMVLSAAAAAAENDNKDKDEASRDLKSHIQRLLEATIEQSGLMERQIAAIGQCGWNIVR